MGFFASVIKDVEGLPADIKALLTSPKLKAAEQEVAKIITAAAPIVKDIAVAVPNKTVQEVIAVYNKYGATVAGDLEAGPLAIGNALLNLAVTELQKLFPASTVTAIENAVTTVLTLLKL